MEHTRKEAINKLSKYFLNGDYTDIKAGSWRCTRLYPLILGENVQIFECIYSGESGPTSNHHHPNSKELFIQLEGTTKFHDGSVLKKGETRLVNPGEEHTVECFEGSKCLVIVIPPDSDLEPSIRSVLAL